jgi:uncharacterized protein YukE
VTGRILFDSTSVDDLGDVLGLASSRISEAITTLESKLEAIVWTGDAESAYTSAQSQWTAVMTEMNSLLKLAGKASAAASTQLVQAETAVASLWERG